MGTHGVICIRETWRIRCGEWTQDGYLITEEIGRILENIAMGKTGIIALINRAEELWAKATDKTMLKVKGEIQYKGWREHEEEYSVFLDKRLRVIYLWPFEVDPGVAVAVWKTKYLVLPGGYDEGYLSYPPDKVVIRWRNRKMRCVEIRVLGLGENIRECMEIPLDWPEMVPFVETKIRDEETQRRVEEVVEKAVR